MKATPISSRAVRENGLWKHQAAIVEEYAAGSTISSFGFGNGFRTALYKNSNSSSSGTFRKPST